MNKVAYDPLVRFVLDHEHEIAKGYRTGEKVGKIDFGSLRLAYWEMTGRKRWPTERKEAK